MLTLALCHLLPETHDEYSEYLKRSGREYFFFKGFPFDYFLVMAGFALMLCLDQVLFKPAWKTIK